LNFKLLKMELEVEDGSGSWAHLLEGHVEGGDAVLRVGGGVASNFNLKYF
jgi:hypothetical protein